MTPDGDITPPRRLAPPVRVWQGVVLLLVILAAGGWALLRPAPTDRQALPDLTSVSPSDAASLRAAEQALRRNPLDQNALITVAFARIAQEQLPQAWPLVARLDPARLTASQLSLLGSALLDAGNPVLAWPLFDAAALRDPSNPAHAQALAALDARRDTLDNAYQVSKRCAAIADPSARAAFLLGLIDAHHPSAGEPTTLAEAILRAFNQVRIAFGAPLPPGTVGLLKARTLLALERHEAAEAALLDVLKIGPNPEAYWLLSRARLQARDLPGASAALIQAEGYHDSANLIPEPAPYVGAARCQECHAAIHQTQQKSHHALTFPRASTLCALPLAATAIADPSAPEFHHTLQCRDGILTQTVQHKGQTRSATVDFAFGSGTHGLTLVGRDHQGQARELRLSYYTSTQAWDRTTGHAVDPASLDEALGRALSGADVMSCLTCHTTEPHAARVNLPPTSLDNGIGCERCHGPGGNHLLAAELEFADPAIMLPVGAKANAITDLCGQCHRPLGGGRSTLVDDPSAARFQSARLVQSACYDPARTDLTCVTCHNPHRDARESPSFYAAKCLSCHASHPDAQQTARSRPCPVNPTADCVRCHMPIVPDIVKNTAFTDHFIRIVREAGTPTRDALPTPAPTR